MDFSVYVGAYLLVPTSQGSRNVEHQECSVKCGHQNTQKSSRFCANCGVPMHTVSVVASAFEHWHCHDLGEAFEDMFFTPESGQSKKSALWLPNEGGAGTVLDQSETNVDDLDPMDEDYVQQQKSAFMNKYGHVMDAIESQFKVKPLLQVGVVPFVN